MKRACLSAIALGLLLSCGGDKTVTPVPPVTAPTPSSPILVTLRIQGPASVPPGQATQMTAVAVFNDGSQRDVTGDARWSSTQPQVATADAGTITGLTNGRTMIRATYSFRDAFLNIVVKPDGTFILNGTITEPVNVPVDGATVSVMGVPASQVTTNNGFYELIGVQGTFILRVSKAGYIDDTRTVTVTQDQRVNIEIRPVSAPMDVSGIYRMILTISPSCAIVPADQKTRTYTAAIGQNAARLQVTLSDANFLPNKNVFSGHVFGQTVTFDLGDSYSAFYYGAVIQEMLPSGTLGIWGSMTGPASTGMIAGTLVGGFTFRVGNTTTGCSASDNQLVLTKK